MPLTRRLLAAAAAFALAATASQALAHARLSASEPAASASVAAPAQISLRFNEKLERAFSRFELTQGASKVPVKVGLAKDGVTLVGAPAHPLAPGAYHVQWRAVSADGHRMTGAYDFTVK